MATSLAPYYLLGDPESGVVEITGVPKAYSLIGCELQQGVIDAAEMAAGAG